jgi:hypothetical protein
MFALLLLERPRKPPAAEEAIACDRCCVYSKQVLLQCCKVRVVGIAVQKNKAVQRAEGISELFKTQPSW